MLRILLLVLLLAFAVVAFAKDERVTLSFDRVSLVEAVRAVYLDLLKEPFVFDADFVDFQGVVSLSLKDVERSTVREVLRELLQQAGFVGVPLGAGVTRFRREKIGEAWETFVYTPRFRSVAYLGDLLGPLFPSGQFGFQRGIGGAAPAGATGSAPGTSPAAAPTTAPAGSAAAVLNRDPDTLIFRGTVADVSRLRGFLERLDVSAGEVVVRAAIYEVTNDASKASAVSVALNLLGGKLTISAGALAAAEYQAVVKGVSFTAAYSTLAADGRFKSVSSPSIRVKSGSTARFSVGSETPVLGGVSYQQGGTAVQSVQYRPSGTILELSPTVRGDVVELQVAQQVSSFGATTNGVNGSPTLLKRELTTTVAVREGELVVLGGLRATQDRQAWSGIPFLPRWLGGDSEQSSGAELVMVLSTERLSP